MRNRPSSTHADRVFGNDKGWRQLLALEFIRRMLDFVQDGIYQICVVTCGNDLLWRKLLFEIKLQDRVHQVIWRQAVLVELIRRQFS